MEPQALQFRLQPSPPRPVVNFLREELDLRREAPLRFHAGLAGGCDCPSLRPVWRSSMRPPSRPRRPRPPAAPSYFPQSTPTVLRGVVWWALIFV